MSASPTIYRPVPRRPFDLPTDDDTPETPDRPPQRSKSTIALTAGALFGIYSQTYDDAAPTPSVTRNNSTANFAELKPRTASPAPPHAPTRRQDPLHLLLRIASLFVFGIAYGIVVTHLHNGARWSPAYLLAWGLAGVGLGSVLPWLDGKDDAPTSVGWTRVVRSIGAFVGIAYAIRKLPWQSTLQVSLALALVNPFLWFLIDRTRSGFWFATLVGAAGTAVLLQVNPEIIQTPGRRSGGGEVAGINVETIAVGTWIASILFCSCVCFGNVGRKLAGKR